MLRNSFNFSLNSGLEFAKIAIAKSAAFFAPAAPIASVPTGIPAGICTIESSESIPDNALLCTGTPKTGKIVCAAHIPGKCAAPPAPAMMTSMPVLRRFWQIQTANPACDAPKRLCIRAPHRNQSKYPPHFSSFPNRTCCP